jgi:hypothetical protein
MRPLIAYQVMLKAPAVLVAVLSRERIASGPRVIRLEVVLTSTSL